MMNKKLMALSLVIGLAFSQVPMQAGLLDTWVTPERVDYIKQSGNAFSDLFSKTVKENPTACALAAGAALGLLYFAYNKYNSPERKLKNTIRKSVSAAVNSGASAASPGILIDGKVMRISWNNAIDANELTAIKNDDSVKTFDRRSPNLVDDIVDFLMSN